MVRQRHCLALFSSVVALGSLAPTLHAARPAAGEDGLASAIEKRLNQAGDLTFPMPPSAGYFEGNPIQPQRAYQVYAGLYSEKSFTFSVVVYKTAAQAAAMYTYDVNHVRAIGGDFHAFKIVRSGRVLYMAATAPAPNTAAPSVPIKAFLSFVALASARL